jgi:hypothetical protein
VGQPDQRPAVPDAFEQRQVGQRDTGTGLAQLGDHLAAIRHEDLLSVADEANVAT